VESLGKESRVPRMLVLAASVLVVGGVVAYAATRPTAPPDGDPVIAVSDAGVDGSVIVPEDLGLETDAGPAEVAEVAEVADAGTQTARPTTSMAVTALRGAKRRVVFRPTPQNVQIAVDDGPFQAYGPDFREVELLPGAHRFRFRGSCCDELDQRIHIRPGREPFYLTRRLTFRPALLMVRSNVMPAVVDVAAKGDAPAARGRAGTLLQVRLGGPEEVRRLTVTGEGGGVYTDNVRLHAGRPTQVRAQIDAPTEGGSD